MSDGPVMKPGREPKERPEPRPKAPVGTPAPAPAPAPRPQPLPRSAPPPIDENPQRGPFQKPHREPKEEPMPTSLSGPIGKRWLALGGLAWGQPTTQPEPVPGGGSGVAFMLRNGQFASIIHRTATGAVVVNPTVLAAWNRQQGGRGPLGLPTTDEMATHDGAGRFQVFDGGLVVWHATTGAWAVFGAIDVAYKAAGGSRYGHPLGDQAPMPDGRAWVQHFRDVATGAERSIFWTPEHGAHPLYGAIRDAWFSYRGGASIGYPTTDEMEIPGGRWQRFEGADYIWRHDTGAHEVHGNIGATYHHVGGSAWGFPTTDETRTPDGRGRFNHFVGPNGEARSIYWTPETGAQAITGAIHQRWAELGWERSHLGYPTGPAGAWAEGGANALQQPFQHGRMLFRADLNRAGPDPIEHFRDFGKSSELQGWVRVRLHSDGRIQYTGHQRATGANSYSFGIQVAVSDGVTAVANAWEGECAGTFESGSRNADWHQDVHNAAVASTFWDYQQGSADIKRFKEKSLGWVSGVLETGLKFLIGSGAGVVLGPAGGLLIVVGTLAGTVIAGGNVQAGLRIINGTLWMAGPSGTFVALVAEGVNQLATDERRPNDEEWRIARSVFGTKLPSRDDIRITNAIGGGDRPFVFKRFDGKTTINMGQWHNDPCGMKVGFWRDADDHSRGVIRRGEKFVHELVHVWQLEHGSDLLLVAKGMAKVFGEEYEYTAGKKFSSYNLEQQGSIVEDWFGRHYTPNSSANDWGLQSAAATDDRTDDLWRYVRDNIRSGTGSAL